LDSLRLNGCHLIEFLCARSDGPERFRHSGHDFVLRQVGLFHSGPKSALNAAHGVAELDLFNCAPPPFQSARLIWRTYFSPRHACLNAYDFQAVRSDPPGISGNSRRIVNVGVGRNSSPVPAVEFDAVITQLDCMFKHFFIRNFDVVDRA